MSERDPSFDDCPTDCAHGADCEAAEMEREFEREAKQIVAASGQTKWTARELLADLNTAFTLDAMHGGESGHAEGWSVRTARFVDVVRGERRKAERIADFNRRQEREAHD